MRGFGTIFGADQSGTADVGLDFQNNILETAAMRLNKECILSVSDSRIAIDGNLEIFGVQELGPLPPPTDLSGVSRWEAAVAEKIIFSSLFRTNIQEISTKISEISTKKSKVSTRNREVSKSGELDSEIFIEKVSVKEKFSSFSNDEALRSYLAAGIYINIYVCVYKYFVYKRTYNVHIYMYMYIYKTIYILIRNTY